MDKKGATVAAGQPHSSSSITFSGMGAVAECAQAWECSTTALLVVMHELIEKKSTDHAADFTWAVIRHALDSQEQEQHTNNQCISSSKMLTCIEGGDFLLCKQQSNTLYALTWVL